MKSKWSKLMKKVLILLSFFALCGVSHAQTAQQVEPSYPTITGCPGGITACFRSSNVPVNSATTESSHVFKASSGTLFGLSVTSSSAGYVLIYNSATAPSDGSVTPVACYYLAGSPGTLGIAFTPFPLRMSTGISVVFSSTGCFTQTSSSTAFFTGEIL